MRAWWPSCSTHRVLLVAVAAALVARFWRMFGKRMPPRTLVRPGALGQSSLVIILALLAQQFLETATAGVGAVGPDDSASRATSADGFRLICPRWLLARRTPA